MSTRRRVAARGFVRVRVRACVFARVFACGGAVLALGCDTPSPAAVDRPETGAAEPDLGRGELLSYACRACHALDRNERNPLGPNLESVFGRAAGTSDFAYSAALREADLVWTPAALDAWLAQPTRFIPGTTMAFTGFRSPADRRDLIAYLLRETSRSVPQ